MTAMSWRFLVVPLTCVAVFGMDACTSLQVHQINDSSTAIPPGAFPYTLQKTTLKPVFTVLLKKCPDLPGAPGDATIELGISAALSQVYEPDSLERYYIDYSKLADIFKTTTLKVTNNADQTLQGINAEVNDQSLQVAGSALQAAAQIAGAATIGSVPAIAANGRVGGALIAEYLELPRPPLSSTAVCKSDVAKALDKLNTDKTALDAKIKALANAAPAPAAGNPSSTDSTLTALSSIVANDQQAVTISIPTSITPKFSDLTVRSDESGWVASYPIRLSDYIDKKWLNALQSEDIRRVKLSINGASARPLDAVVSLELRVFEWSSGCDRSQPHSAKESKDKGLPVASIVCAKDPFPSISTVVNGLVLRQPAIGYVRICIDSCMNTDAFKVLPVESATGAPLDLLTPMKVTLPQLGKRLVFPLENGIGVDATIGLTLGSDGSIATMSFGSMTTAASGISAIGTAAGAYSGVVTANNAATTAINGAASAQIQANINAVQFSDTVLKAQADCLAQTAAIVKAGGTPAASCK